MALTCLGGDWSNTSMLSISLSQSTQWHVDVGEGIL